MAPDTPVARRERAIVELVESDGGAESIVDVVDCSAERYALMRALAETPDPVFRQLAIVVQHFECMAGFMSPDLREPLRFVCARARDFVEKKQSRFPAAPA